MKDGLQEIYYRDGSVSYQFWYENGKLHREDGPAVVSYYKDGSIESQRWYINDEYLIDRIPQEMLIAYMTSHNLTLAELLLSNDELIRTSTQSYKWNKLTVEGGKVL